MRFGWLSWGAVLALLSCSGVAGAPQATGHSSSQGDETGTSSGSGQGGAAGLLSCVGAGKATLSGDVQPIFSAQCVECHGGPRPQDGLNLEKGKAYAAVVNVSSIECTTNYVTPNNPSQSYLVNKITGINICSDDQMPLGGQLDMADMQTIINWVCSGAPDD